MSLSNSESVEFVMLLVGVNDLLEKAGHHGGVAVGGELALGHTAARKHGVVNHGGVAVSGHSAAVYKIKPNFFSILNYLGITFTTTCTPFHCDLASFPGIFPFRRDYVSDGTPI